MARLNVNDLSRGDVRAASEVLQASAAHFAGRGLPLWLPEHLTPQALAQSYPDGSWRVLRQGTQPNACYCLLPTDPEFWPDDPEGQALYLHKLAVHPAAQGHGLARELLRLAVQETAAAGRPWLKLDTAANRPKLRALYTGFGFTEVGERQMDRFVVVLMQLRVQDGVNTA